MFAELMDQYPECRYNLGRVCAENDLWAGDHVECPGCGNLFDISEWDNGTEAGWDFELVPVEKVES